MLKLLAVSLAISAIGHGYFIAPGGKQNFADARASCQAQGSDLAKVVTEADVDAAYAIDGLQYMWIGLQKPFTNWLIDNSPVTETMWRDGQPDNVAGIENCAHLHQAEGRVPGAYKVWNDLRCDSLLAVGLCDGTPPPVCNLPESQWLETQFAPLLYTAGSGFVTGAVDTFRFAFDYHRKYGNRYFNTGALDADETEATTPHTKLSVPVPAQQEDDSECYDHITLDIEWGKLVPFCSRDATTDPAFVIYTCKVTMTGNEILDPIRQVALSRIVHNEIPVQVLFPKQVSASVGDLSAFQPPNVLAAITRQEVNVNVNDLGDLVAKVHLYTSVQYPFMLDTPTWPAAAATPTGIAPGAAPTNIQQCDVSAVPAGPDSPGQPGDALACNQVWELDLDVAGGANPATSVCQLDGDYKFSWQASCQPKFPSDCPLVADDLGQIQNLFSIDFKLDSEYFCPQVVDTVDVRASMQVFKDLAHTITASNFILGQTGYFVAKVESDKATVVKATLDDLWYNRGAGDVNYVVDKVEQALGADNINGLVVFNSGQPATNGAVVPQDEVWFHFLVSNPPFLPPVDGSEDFSVSVTLDVEFKDAGALLLQVARNRQIGTSAASSLSDRDDDSAAAGSRAQQLTFTLAAAGASAAALF